MSHRQKYAAILLLVVVLAAMFWFMLGPGSDAPDSSGTSLSPTRTAQTVAKPTASKMNLPRADEPPMVPEGPSDWESVAYEEVSPGKARIRCTVNGVLPDGAFETHGSPPLIFPVVTDGVLTAAVNQPSGQVVVGQRLQGMATVRWTGAKRGLSGCSVAPLRPIQVRGTVRDADGEPVEDVLIRGCDHGEIIRSDASGQFELQMAAGTDCRPMAFIEHDDGFFSKGSFAELLDPTGDIDGVELTVPDGEQALSPETLADMASQLADMNEAMADQRQSELDRLNTLIDSGAFSDEDRARLDSWLALEQETVGRIREQTTQLREPEERVNAMREAWLNQY